MLTWSEVKGKPGVWEVWLDKKDRDGSLVVFQKDGPAVLFSYTGALSSTNWTGSAYMYKRLPLKASHFGDYAKRLELMVDSSANRLLLLEERPPC